jgi:hypothetical protein
MYIDQNLLFVDTMTTTTSAAATDYIDTTVASIKLGDGYAPGLWWVIKTESAFATRAGAPTATFQLQTSDSSAFLDSTTVTLAQTASFLTAALTANTVMARIKVPLGVKRYLRTYLVVDSGAQAKSFETVSYSAFLTTDVDNNLP